MISEKKMSQLHKLFVKSETSWNSIVKFVFNLDVKNRDDFIDRSAIIMMMHQAIRGFEKTISLLTVDEELNSFLKEGVEKVTNEYKDINNTIKH